MAVATLNGSDWQGLTVRATDLSKTVRRPSIDQSPAATVLSALDLENASASQRTAMDSGFYGESDVEVDKRYFGVG